MLAVTGACAAAQDTGRAPAERPALRPVPLPDMGGAAGIVQSDLRQRLAALTVKADSPATGPDDLADAFGDMGRRFVAAEYLDAAESCFANAQRLAPDNMRWPYYLGQVYRFRNEPDKAAGFFVLSLTLQPDHVPTLVWIGEMRLAQNRPEAAERFFTMGLARQTRSAAARYGLGRAALARRQYAEAVTHLEAALALEPEASRIHYLLSIAYRGRGDRRNADAHLRLSGDTDIPLADPLLVDLGATLQRAAVYRSRGSEAVGRRDWTDAIRNLRLAIEVTPRNPGIRLNLGTALHLSGDAAGALEQFAEALRLAPESSPAHYSLGVLDEAAGRDSDAIERFTAAVTYDPGSVAARMQLADALRRNGRLDESLAHYAEVIRTSPAMSQARLGYAMALVRLQRYQEARARLTEAVNAYPGQPAFAHALARVLAAAPDDRVRDGRRALALIRPLIEQRQTIAVTEAMAMALAETGEYEQAAMWQREAISEAERAGRTDLLQPMSASLALYQGRRPCRSPWRDDDPVFYPRPAR